MARTIEIEGGDLLLDDADALVNTVNCVGVMGAGVAKAFKERYPLMFSTYRRRCAAGSVRTGTMDVWANPGHPANRIVDDAPAQAPRTPVLANPRLVVNFPTKQHWRDPSRIEWVVEGLVDLTLVVNAHRITSIAIPPLGCGLGGLDWRRVRPMVHAAAAVWPDDVEVRLYLPR